MEENTQNSPGTPPFRVSPDLDNPLSFLEDYDHAIPLKPLRTSFNLPAYHRQILTPSEQLHLQSTLGDLKNLLLRRVTFSGEISPEKLAPPESAKNISPSRPVFTRDFLSELDTMAAALSSAQRKGTQKKSELISRGPLRENEPAGDVGPSTGASGMRAGHNPLKRRAEAVEENRFATGTPSPSDTARNKVRIAPGPDGAERYASIADTGAKEQQTSKGQARASTLPRQPDQRNNMPDIIVSSYQPSHQRLENLSSDAHALRKARVEAVQKVTLPPGLALKATRDDILGECNSMMKVAAAAVAARPQQTAPKHQSTRTGNNNVQGPTGTTLVPGTTSPHLKDSAFTNKQRTAGRAPAHNGGASASNASRARSNGSGQYKERGFVTDEDPDFSWFPNPSRQTKKHAPRKGNKVDDPAYRYTKPDTAQEAADDAIRPDFDDINPHKPPKVADLAFNPSLEDEETDEEPAASTVKKPTPTKKGKRNPKIVTLVGEQSAMDTPANTPVSNTHEGRAATKKVARKGNASNESEKAVSADVSAKKTFQKKSPAENTPAPKKATPQRLAVKETPSRVRRSSPRLARK